MRTLMTIIFFGCHLKHLIYFVLQFLFVTLLFSFWKSFSWIFVLIRLVGAFFRFFQTVYRDLGHLILCSYYIHFHLPIFNLRTGWQSFCFGTSVSSLICWKMDSYLVVQRDPLTLQVGYNLTHSSSLPLVELMSLVSWL